MTRTLQEVVNFDIVTLNLTARRMVTGKKPYRNGYERGYRTGDIQDF